MGCWPFTEESYNVGDMQDAQSELEAAMYLRRTVLGYYLMVRTQPLLILLGLCVVVGAALRSHRQSTVSPSI